MNGCLLRDIKPEHVENENGKRLREPRRKKDIELISTILDINQDAVVELEAGKKTRKPRKRKEISSMYKSQDETQDDVKIRMKKRKPRKKLEKIVYYVYCSPGPGPVNEIDDIIQKWMNYHDDD